MTLRQDWTRRAFLQNVGVVAPTVKLMLTGDTGEGVEVEGARPIDSIKFAPIDLSSHFTASPSDFGKMALFAPRPARRTFEACRFCSAPKDLKANPG